MAHITLDDVAYRYPGSDEDVLTALHLEVANGEAHALLGASGSGKTTLLNLLSGILTPSAGRVLFNGVDVSTLPGKARNITQVFQFPVLYESLSVADNLAFPLRVRKFDAAVVAERVAYISKELAIGAIQSAKPRALTLVEKQMVAVGKALVRPDVSVVLLDEPLTAVEPKVKWRLRQTLRKVQADLGVTMIYVTHDQTEALTFADRVSVLAADGILQTDTPRTVYESPSHEFVGHFVGSPGMNFVPAHALGVHGCERVGFRPEWASLRDDGPLRGVVSRTRMQGTRDGRPFGLVTLTTRFGPLVVRTAMADESLLQAQGQELGLRVHRYVGFHGQRRVAQGELV